MIGVVCSSKSKRTFLGRELTITPVRKELDIRTKTSRRKDLPYVTVNYLAEIKSMHAIVTSPPCYAIASPPCYTVASPTCYTVVSPTCYTVTCVPWVDVQSVHRAYRDRLERPVEWMRAYVAITQYSPKHNYHTNKQLSHFGVIPTSLYTYSLRMPNGKIQPYEIWRS
ncbi:hypothetical protein TNCV_2978551 [Trichonephila clavipes]|nr:hypothetical protein TNCV_2978551 [Trichonephila clavipes]